METKIARIEARDVVLNQFSPTGFYSSAVRNNFLKELEERNKRQVKFSLKPEDDMLIELLFGRNGSRSVYITANDYTNVQIWQEQGFDVGMKTPDNTLIFVSQKQAEQIKKDQVACTGCLSACRFSGWKDRDEYTTGRLPDPRTFCMQKTLQNIIRLGNIDWELMFSGHNAFRFATDPFYKNKFIPTIKQLVARILTGY